MSNKLLNKLASLDHISAVDIDSYKGLRVNMEFNCKYHGNFTCYPDSIFNSYNGCKCCASKNKGYEFIVKAKQVHGDKYSYNLDDYVCSRTLMPIFCKTHKKIFHQRPSAHLQGQGCDLCGEESRVNTKTSKGLDKFLSEAKRRFGDTYSYNLVDYKTTKTPVTIICPVHGQFNIVPDNHLYNSETGCIYCDKSQLEIRKTEEFNSKLITLRPNKFDTSEVSYINNTTPVKLKCLEHDEWFYQTPLKMLDPSRNCSCNTCYKLSNNRWTIEAVAKIPNIETKSGYVYVGEVDTVQGVKLGVCEDLEHRLSVYQRDLRNYNLDFNYVFTEKSNYLEAFVIETAIKHILRSERFKEETIKFGGYTEMFNQGYKKVIKYLILELRKEDLKSIRSEKDVEFINLINKYKRKYGK